MLERNSTSVENVAGPLVSTQNLVNTPEFTLVRSPDRVTNVAEALDCAQTLLDITQFTPERDTADVNNVTKPLMDPSDLLNTESSCWEEALQVWAVRQSLQSEFQRGHAGDGLSRCEQYDKAFGQISTFIQHQRIHKGEKPYTCEECDESFDQSSRLIQQQRIHTRKNLNKCGSALSQYSDPS
ncbi:putative zinc finger protein 826 [Fukomys damarensis]|uniref:putative zinc finger protein 826 n=1 Tax=Fukomys damarensis TaxID=885580 RepID=UPI00054007AC|nr:putative zinc finger protein 826 [Fukomys damarensis]